VTYTPGDRVHNQDTAHPMMGTVIPTPEGQGEPDGWIWIDWDNGLVCSEYPADVTPAEAVSHA